MPAIWEGAAAGGAIRLGEAGDILAVTEGIETGIAVTEATSIPVWVARLQLVALRSSHSRGLKTLIVFADHDQPLKGGKGRASRLVRGYSRLPETRASKRISSLQRSRAKTGLMST